MANVTESQPDLRCPREATVSTGQPPAHASGVGQGLRDRLQFLVRQSGSVVEAAARLSVRPSTVSKMLMGKTLTKNTIKKVEEALSSDNTLGETSLVARLRAVHTLYTQLGTLEAVGRRLSLTRERVRQLLNKGVALGLFEYEGRAKYRVPYISKDKLISDYRTNPNFHTVARLNHLSLKDLRKLFTAHGVTKDDLRAQRSEQARRRCVGEFSRISEQLGHYPSTAELQADPRFHYLDAKIRHYWGSIYAFRRELDIPNPPPGSKTFGEDIRYWAERRRRLAIIVRMQHLDRIRECLRSSGSLSASAIGRACELKSHRVSLLVRLLVATGEVKRYGEGWDTRYRLETA